MFEDMEEELEWFDESPNFNDLCVHLNVKFGGDFALKWRFDSGKTRAHYVLMPLCDRAHWSCYNRVIQGSNVPMPEVVVENGYRCRVSRIGRPLMVLEAMNKNWGPKRKQLRVTWIWTVN
jgi:hypothetical protein